MTLERWTATRELFERALDLPAGARRAFVATQAGGDRELERDVLRLLDHEGESLLRPPTAQRLQEAVDPQPLAPGDRVGRYRIVRLLGRGGMGWVFEAEQEKPSRRVALKVMSGLLDESVARRFELEAETLARLRHPGIATIHEFGVHPEPGVREARPRVPYFALELVEGARDLVRFADEEQLDLSARLALFRQVCAAVHHAHERGVIHRDLKPGNLLVDRSGRPKVIDYGIARHMDPLRGRETQAGHVLGTLQYSSPEQLSGGSADVDLRTDVYSLGVVLYELLTGAPPHETRERPIAAIIDEVCHRDPPPPSSGRAGLPRELDWIVARALAKEPTRRYASAAELAADLERLERNEPVSAGPETARYRIAKFVRRHRLPVALAALALASLIGGLVATTRALVRAEDRRVEAEAARANERQEAERARVALRRQEAVVAAVGNMFRAAQADQDGREVTVLSVLERTEGSLEQLADEPEVRAELLSFMANTYFHLGLYERAGEVAEAAIVALDDLPEPDPGGRAVMRTVLVHTHMVATRFDEAEAELDLVVQDLAASGEEDPEGTISVLDLRAQIQDKQGRPDAALLTYRRVLPIAEQSLGANPTGTISTVANYGQLAFAMRRFDEAREALTWAYERALATWGAEHAYTLGVTMKYAALLASTGEQARAAELQAQAFEAVRRIFGETHRNTLASALNLSLTLAAAGDHAASLARAQAALAVVAEHHSGDDELTIALRGPEIDALLALDRSDEARAAIEATIERMEAGPFARHPRLLLEYQRLGELELGLGQFEPAERALRSGCELAARILEAEHGSRVRTCGLLGRALLRLGRFEESAEHLRATVAVAERYAGKEDGVRTLREFLPDLIGALEALGLESERAERQMLLDGLP